MQTEVDQGKSFRGMRCLEANSHGVVVDVLALSVILLLFIVDSEEVVAKFSKGTLR